MAEDVPLAAGGEWVRWAAPAGWLNLTDGRRLWVQAGDRVLMRSLPSGSAVVDDLDMTQRRN